MAMPHRFTLRIVILVGTLAALVFAASASAATYTRPPTGQNQWYWDISPSGNGLAGLPSVTGAYPAPGSANIWDTDMFTDSNTDGGVPTGPSPVVQALHAAGKYSICYVEAGAQQAEPDASSFAAADYTNGSNTKTTQMQGYSGEYWYDLRGFANYVAGQPSTLTGAAVNIAAGLGQRIKGCATEGQNALEPDDLDGYTNKSQTGAAGGGWGLTQSDSAGFERWLAYTAHSDGLAIFQKNDTDNIGAAQPLFDGAITEECNYYSDPCSEWAPYYKAGKPVLNAEYTQDGETTSRFCSADTSAGITGALFDVNLDGSSYQPCAPVGKTVAGGSGSGGSTGGTGGTGAGGTGTGGTGTGGTGTGGTGTGGTGTGGSGGSGAHAPANTHLPTLSGTSKSGRRLTTSTGSWSGSPTSFSYAWQRCKAAACSTVKSATNQTYRLGSSDVGYQLVAIVTARNATGAAAVHSARSAVVTGKADRSHEARLLKQLNQHTATQKKKHRRASHPRRHRHHASA
jgi:hypothetical protein